MHTQSIFFTWCKKRHSSILVVVILLIAFGIGGRRFVNLVPQSASADSTTSYGSYSVENWWPANGIRVTGVQPFKAALNPGLPLDAYSMFWQVDGGQLNRMSDSYIDYPHKESSVDLQSWTWKGAGPYTITYVATDAAGKEIGKKSFSIFTNSAGMALETPSQSQSATPQTSAPALPRPAREVSVWWPSDKARVEGKQPFKGILADTPITEYAMYWQVDGGGKNLMMDSNEGFPHKEIWVDLSGWRWRGEGPYKITLGAEDRWGRILAEKTVEIFAAGSSFGSSNQETAAFSDSPAVQSGPIAVLAATDTHRQISGNPFAGSKLFVETDSPAARQAREWQSWRAGDAEKMRKMAEHPKAVWLGSWNGNIREAVEKSMSEAGQQGAMPVFVAYNIPQRDCGGYSAGGVNGYDSYKEWIQSLAESIGNHKAAVILEPDALSQLPCLSTESQNSRLQALRNAVSLLKSRSNISVYLDAGHARWVPAAEMADRLKRAGVDQADGFALNISNFLSNDETARYGEEISSNTGGKHFVVDTSRNGAGPAQGDQWCNPPGRALGRETISTGRALIDAYLWIKAPGESDGNCNGGPPAGTWWPEYALGLIEQAGL